MSLTVLDAEGRELRRADLDDSGCKLPPGMDDRACLVGTLRLLEDIARRDDNPHYRAAARKQADAIKRMVKRMTKDRGSELSDHDIFGEPLKVIGGRRALPPTTDVLTIDMK
jgi:hypothetical protein